MDYIVLDAGAAYSLLAAGGRDGLELTTRTAAGVIILGEIAVELFGPAGFDTDRAALNSDPKRQAIFDWINSEPKVIKEPRLNPTEADARLYKFGFQTGNFDSGDIAIMKFIHGQSGAGNSYHIVTDNHKDFELFPEKLFKLTGHNDASVAYSTFGFLSEAFHTREINGQDYISFRDNLSGSYRNAQINPSIASSAKLTDADVRAFDISDLPPDIDFRTARIMAGAVVVLKQLGFVGNMFSLAGTIAEANARVEAGDLPGAERVWFEYFGNLAVGGAGAFTGALLAAGFLAGTGVGTVPAALIILAAALGGGIIGGLMGEIMASELHSFVIEKFNNGEPIILDEFVGVYHSRLREEGIFEETVLTQALLGIGNPLTGHATAQQITDAVLAQIAQTPELLEDRGAFTSALARVIERKGPLLNWAESLEIYRTIIETDAGPFCFLPHTPITLADGTTKPISALRPGDMVLSPDKTGALVPARVTRTFVNDVAHVLDFHGTGVTPGHVFLCGAGRFKGRHVPLIDILRDDGAVVRQDGSLMRASTGCAVGSDGKSTYAGGDRLAPRSRRVRLRSWLRRARARRRCATGAVAVQVSGDAVVQSTALQQSRASGRFNPGARRSSAAVRPDGSFHHTVGRAMRPVSGRSDVQVLATE